MRKGYRTYVDIGEHGEIHRIMTTLKEMEGMVEITCSPLCREAGNHPNQYLINPKAPEKDRVQPKKVIHLVPDHKVLVADGEHFVTIQIEGVPEEVEKVKVDVMGETFLVPRGEALEVSSSREKSIKVQIVDPRFFSRPLYLYSKK